MPATMCLFMFFFSLQTKTGIIINSQLFLLGILNASRSFVCFARWVYGLMVLIECSRKGTLVAQKVKTLLLLLLFLSDCQLVFSGITQFARD